MSNIPAFRNEVEQIVHQIRTVAWDAKQVRHPELCEDMLAIANRLKEATPLLDRKVVKRRAPIKSRSVTPNIARDIIAMVDSNPRLHAQEIADHFGINPGRVSEVLSKRDTYVFSQ